MSVYVLLQGLASGFCFWLGLLLVTVNWQRV